MLTTNVDVTDGLVNGARGEVVHVVSDNDNALTHILVKFDHPNVGIQAKLRSQFGQQYPMAVPLKRHEAIFLARGKHGSEISRLQFPLTLAWATTIQKVQGLTLDQIVVDMKGGRFNPEQANVAFSHVKNVEDLYIVNFNEKAIKASEDVKAGMERLNTNLLSPLPVYTCPDNYITLALLNIRSLYAKLADIDCDDSLACASILCFTETWLTPQMETPCVRDNWQAARADRLSGDNKGGVLVSFSDTIRLVDCNNASLENTAMEIMVTVLRLPSGQCFQLMVVYRSPSVSLDTVLETMSNLLGIHKFLTWCQLLWAISMKICY